jgi:hypothetical protein
VTVDEIWIDNQIYWTLQHITGDYTWQTYILHCSAW